MWCSKPARLCVGAARIEIVPRMLRDSVADLMNSASRHMPGIDSIAPPRPIRRIALKLNLRRVCNAAGLWKWSRQDVLVRRSGFPVRVVGSEGVLGCFASSRDFPELFAHGEDVSQALLNAS